MFEKLGLTRMAQSLAAHSGARLEAVARNIANADTPSYRAYDLPEFSTLFRDAGAGMRQSRAGHITSTDPFRSPVVAAGAGTAPNGNAVSLDQEMMKAVQTRQNHEMALAIYRSTSTIIRASLGRNG